MKVVIMLL